jgi:hypothetical protein
MGCKITTTLIAIFFVLRNASSKMNGKKQQRIAQPYQDGARGENLRPKIATMAAGRRARTIPGGQEQARRDGGASN